MNYKITGRRKEDCRNCTVYSTCVSCITKTERLHFQGHGSNNWLWFLRHWHWSSCDLNGIFTFIVSAARLCRTLLFLCLNKLSLLSWLNKRNKQTDREGQHSFILYNFVYTVCGGPCHLYRLQTAFWDLFLPLRTACLFSYGEKKHFWMFVLFPHWYCKYSNIFCSQKHRKTFLLWFFFHFQIL